MKFIKTNYKKTYTYGSGSYRKKKKKRLGKGWGVAGGILLVLGILYVVTSLGRTGTLTPTAELLDGHATFRFLDVGQGDCTLVTWQGEAVLIDAGSAWNGHATAESVQLYAPEVDYFIITHPHEDHMGGAADVLENVYVKNLVLPAAQSEEHFYTKTLETAAKKKINVITVSDGAEFSVGGIHIEIFDPLDLPMDDLNDASLITRIDADGVSLLVTGDAELAAETHVLGLGDPALDCDILKVAHHGSDSSSSAEFLEAVTPQIGVISVGRNNSYGHPHRETVERLTECGCIIHRTDREGTVILRGDGAD